MQDKKINKVYRGVIKDWQLHNLSITKDKLDEIARERDEELMLPLIITGAVAFDPTGRFQVGWHMKTSQLTYINEDEGYCESRYSIYQLEGLSGHDIYPDLGDVVRFVSY